MIGTILSVILSLPATAQTANTLGRSASASYQAIGSVIQTLATLSANSNGFFDIFVDKAAEEIEKKMNGS